MKYLVSLWIACSLLIGSGAKAADIHDFHNAQADAYKHYRSATFYLRTGNPSVASFELADLLDKWRALNKRFRHNPPAIYSQDDTWDDTMQEIELRIDQGTKAAEEGDMELAQKKLSRIRQLLSDIRRRNGVFIFSDVVDKANAAFDDLYDYRHNAPDFAKPEQVEGAQKALSIVSYWYEQCFERAPKAIKDNPQFGRLIVGSLESFGKAWIALREKDTRRFINLLREVGASNRMLYLKFG